ncbi:MAG: sulfur oxidation c-type cytochrome SoxX [Congregibacter sp.]|nr:sulfur oxidation c-type cytochrome SoxX [Congregibacter sp.]MDP5070580.1 sulfur oxidation c-type cytochrome SoxX [Congregibacter sp.]
MGTRPIPRKRYLSSIVFSVACASVLAGVNARAADAQSIAEGQAIAADRDRGNCYSCHMAEGAEMTGNGGPPLVMMQLRFPERDVLKAQIADPRIRNPNTVMPPYGAHGILTDRELELVVDYVHSL